MTNATRPLHASATATPASSAPRPPSDAPWWVRAPGPLFNVLLRVGLPAGPNRLVTIRGRKTGAPRTLAIAVPEIQGRRYVLGAYGDVQWVRNLRAAGEATVRIHGRDVPMTAHELDHGEAVEYFATILPRYIASFPSFGRAFARILFGLVGSEILDDPELAAKTRPVFELAPRS
jgi:deazaflavin-dependent oxidoreductase (nitroreductase family)